MSENKEKTTGELLREKLLYKPKNGFKTLSETELAVVDAYCEGYKQYLDAAKTEREAVKAAIMPAAPPPMIKIRIVALPFPHFFYYT